MYCKHGVYVGNQNGADHMCGKCESERTCSTCRQIFESCDDNVCSKCKQVELLLELTVPYYVARTCRCGGEVRVDKADPVMIGVCSKCGAGSFQGECPTALGYMG